MAMPRAQTQAPRERGLFHDWRRKSKGHPAFWYINFQNGSLWVGDFFHFGIDRMIL